jgi:hypothetical protein
VASVAGHLQIASHCLRGGIAVGCFCGGGGDGDALLLCAGSILLFPGPCSVHPVLCWVAVVLLQQMQGQFVTAAGLTVALHCLGQQGRYCSVGCGVVAQTLTVVLAVVLWHRR